VKSILLLSLPALVGGALVRAETIYWYSVAGGHNLTSTGALMQAGFSFEAGVFKNNFVPTAANKQIEVFEFSSCWRSV
jgi:hypothetical protein